MRSRYVSCETCYIKKCSILKNCNPIFLDLIDKKKLMITFRAGSPIILQDSEVDGVYIVFRGLAKVHVKGFRGREFILRLAEPGSIVGHTPEGEKKQTVSITAVEETEVCLIKNADFNEAVKNCDGIRSSLFDIYKKEIKEMEQRTISLVQMNVREKTAEALIRIAEAYHFQNGDSKRINLSRQEIADFTGTAKEQVSKALADFRNEQLIEASGKNLTLLNIEGLREIVK